MASLTLQGSSSGQITLTPPAVAGTNTLTLPASTGTLVTSESASISGNLTFTGTGNRILGDFSNATVANRVAFQTSTTNGATTVLALPNGTGTTASWDAYNNSDPTNSSYLGLSALSTEVRLSSTIRGTGTFLPMTFYTGGSERMRIDTSGNVGIGTTSPAGRLQISSSAGNIPLYVTSSAASQNVRIRLNSSDTSSSVAYVWSYSDASLNKQASIYLTGTGGLATQVGQTAGAEPTTGTSAMLIDSSGNVGIGTTSAAGKFDVYSDTNSVARYHFRNGNAGTSAYSAIDFGNNLGPSQVTLALNSSTNTTYGGANSFNIIVGNANITFNTNGSERMRIDSSGNGFFGTTTSYGRFTVVPTTTQYSFASNAPNSSGTYYHFHCLAAGTTVGTIASTSTTTTYGTSSDYRLKHDVQTMTSGLATIAALKPVTYKWNIDDSIGEGFIAHELAEHIPLAVVGEKDAINEDGSINAQSVDYSKIVVHLVAAMQEQQSIISDLQSRIAALEAK